MEKTEPQQGRWLKRMIIAGFVLLLLMVGVYRSGQPNYRSFEREYSRLHIPADWQLMDETLEKGNFGWGCWTKGVDISCPVIRRSYEAERRFGQAQEKQIFLDIVKDTGFKIEDSAPGALDCIAIRSGNGYTCEYKAKKGNIVLRFSVNSQENNTKKGYSLHLN